MEQHVYPTLYFVLFWTIMCTLLSILFCYGPLCVPYPLFCFTMEQHVCPTLYFVLLWTIVCTLLSILFYFGPLCVP